jgi:hypothetical protein
LGVYFNKSQEVERSYRGCEIEMLFRDIKLQVAIYGVGNFEISLRKDIRDVRERQTGGALGASKCLPRIAWRWVSRWSLEKDVDF